MAADASVRYANDDIGIEATLGGRFRGAQASMMYVEEGSDDHYNISDQLGDLNIYRVYGDVNYWITDSFNFGVEPYMEKALNTDYDKVTNYTFNNKDNMKLYAKPYFTVDLDGIGLPATVEGYAEGYKMSKDEDAVTSFFGEDKLYTMESAGLKWSQDIGDGFVKGFDATYVFDNTNTNYLFNYLYGTVNCQNDLNFQFGCGVRTANNDNDDPTNPFGFFVGMNKKLRVLAKPVFYCQFMYAMDPYNDFNDGPTAYKLDGYKFKSHSNEAVETYKENYAVRIGFQWDI
jgi:hypothetical protein